MKKWCLVNFLFYFLIVTAQNQYQTYTNPVLVPGNFNGTNINSTADPHVFQDTDGTYYMYVTGNGYPCFSSRDLVNWTYEKKVFTGSNRKWAVQGFWAPEVIKIGEKYYLHYTAGREDNIKHIGVAVANHPTGPFVDVNDYPFIDNGAKGTIDSHVFIDDDGKTYMYYSNAMSTNPVPEWGGKKRSEIWVVEIQPDFSGFLSEPVMLIYPQQNWEYKTSSNQYWNEGAVVLKNNGMYYLIFSANCYCAANYAVGYATSTSPMGPFTKSPGNPILSNSGVSHAVSGPGHNSVVRGPDGESWYFVYHSHVHVGNLNSDNSGIRQVNIDRMFFNHDGTMSVSGPSITPQPYPVVSGVSNARYQNLRIYPSVVENELIIDHNIHNPEAMLTVNSILGHSLRFPVQSHSTIDLSGLPTGIYQVSLTDGTQQYRSKILKK